jgi:hypothetical protein
MLFCCSKISTFDEYTSIFIYIGKLILPKDMSLPIRHIYIIGGFISNYSTSYINTF